MKAELTDVQIEGVAQQLAESAETCVPVERLDAEPADIVTGYRIQDAGHDRHGDSLIGWKAGCTSAMTRRSS